VRLFVDTSAWFALYHLPDDAHAQAERFWKDLQRRPARLVTSDYIFDETITLVRARGGHGAARRLGDFLLSSRVVDLAEVSSQVRGDAWNLFVLHQDEDFSFTDCTSFVIMRALGLTDTFAFDDHFVQMGFRLWPEA
jgi:predicted nucleic acid-binding protein